MKFLKILKFSMIVVLPFLAFLLVFDYAAFNINFYKEKFSEYGVYSEIPQADSLNLKVINFITGKNDSLPDSFNERERRHLLDVRKVIEAAKKIMHILVFIFALLFLISALILKNKNNFIKFAGKAFVFGGFLTLILSGLLFLLLISDFSSLFESFHQLLFEKGTYLFDPSREIIVRLYPEQIFMALGQAIAEGVILSSAGLILLGALMIFITKNKKNKNAISKSKIKAK